jgi:anti-sigma B factor antagonist
MAESRLIAPTGDLDIAAVPAFRAELAAARADTSARVIVDLTDVEFIDSSGLGAVVDTSTYLQREGRTLSVVAPRGSAAALLLTLSNFRRHLDVYETQRDATAV